MTDSTGTQVEDAVYTAFGEKISGPDRRYGYIGGWGYQHHSEMNYHHVGARYYDSSNGRFLQRDPIGIDGGLNVYEYVLNRPTIGIDPTGNVIWGWVASTARAAASWAWRKAAVPAARSASRTAGRYAATCVRWMNRGKIRFGPSWNAKKKGLYLSFRYKKHHFDVWKIK